MPFNLHARLSYEQCSNMENLSQRTQLTRDAILITMRKDNLEIVLIIYRKILFEDLGLQKLKTLLNKQKVVVGCIILYWVNNDNWE